VINKLKYFIPALFLAGLPVSAALPPPTIIGFDTIEQLLARISNFLFTIGMIGGVIVIVLSGIKWMMASGDPKEARQMLISGIIGVAVIMAVGLILKTVSALVTGDFFN